MAHPGKIFQIDKWQFTSNATMFYKVRVLSNINVGTPVKIFNNTKTTSKTGKVTDFTKLKEGQTIDMMQMASVVSANIE